MAVVRATKVLEVEVRVLELEVTALELETTLLELEVAALEPEVTAGELEVIVLELEINVLTLDVVVPDERAEERVVGEMDAGRVELVTGLRLQSQFFSYCFSTFAYGSPAME